VHHCHLHPSIVHSKLDYCNTLYYNLPESQIIRLQQIQNSLARAVVKAPKSCHITAILRSLHWLKITERIEYKLLSQSHLVRKSSQPSNLHIWITSSLFNLLAALALHLSSLARPPTPISLRITDRSFRYSSPCLWNQLPSSLRQPHSSHSVSHLPVHAPITFSYSLNSPLSPSINTLYHSRFKTHLFHKSLPPQTLFPPQD